MTQGLVQLIEIDAAADFAGLASYTVRT
jgi:hypothetical protein